ncbi:hypothetical protein K1X12_16200 [Hyphomonas sp. WL0036]|uniref:hypothetical protein n=1 Tax=Hyphomonas sediminis TaxID=2866160 RepID=UPI001C7E5DA2|nr:hypothetical protein [Hyphomonas sediminis]MBY9068444.1 hypothetical protein [Hyphomonas sediminis]
MLKPLAALAALAAISAQVAFACSCPPCEHYDVMNDEKSAIFVGELVSTQRQTVLRNEVSFFESPISEVLVSVFKVTRPIKGDLPQYVHTIVEADHGNCPAMVSYNGLNAIIGTELYQTGNWGTAWYYVSECPQKCWYEEQFRSLVTEQTVQTEYVDKVLAANQRTYEERQAAKK